MDLFCPKLSIIVFNMKKPFKWEFRDSKGRIIVGRRHNNQLVFMRYVDMLDREKKLLIALYAMGEKISEDDIENPKIKEMVKFLNFKDNNQQDEYCG